MDFTDQFKPLVKRAVWKNQASLPDMSREEIESECWLAVLLAIQRWNGAKGKLSSWVYRYVYGRMKDLKKRPPLKRALSYHCLNFDMLENYIEDSDEEEWDPDDNEFFLDKI